MSKLVTLERTLPAEAIVVWQVLTNKQHLERWFASLSKDFNLELSFADPSNPTTSWSITRLVSLALVEFTTKTRHTKGENHQGKIVWRLIQENGEVKFVISDQTLYKSFPFSILEEYQRKRWWHTTLNNLELYIEEISGKHTV